jgi:hypothetical protein
MEKNHLTSSVSCGLNAKINEEVIKIFFCFRLLLKKEVFLVKG